MVRKIKENSVVSVNYEGRTDDGKLFDTSIEDTARKESIYSKERVYEPLHFTLGQGMVIKGFENALIGMHEGEEKTVKIKASEAYGERKEELVKIFPKDPERDKELKIGTIIMVDIQGRKIPAMVTGVDENIKIDFNPILAGKELIFKIKVIKIEE